MKLVIIEGPGKRDTLKKYLGAEYDVVATKGHIRDLPVKGMGVDVSTNFEPKYEIMPGKEAIIKELTESSRVIENITGKKVEVFRPPYGDYNNTLIETAEALGFYSIQWDVDSLDWKDLSAYEIERRVVERVKAGSIVLFHNQGLHTAEALLGIIKTLKGQGYEFVPIGELIYKTDFVTR
jgi:peptidoglycan/xylan/chitin deacetylase (PgdA/CDA1 family)